MDGGNVAQGIIVVVAGVRLRVHIDPWGGAAWSHDQLVFHDRLSLGGRGVGPLLPDSPSGAGVSLPLGAFWIASPREAPLDLLLLLACLLYTSPSPRD